MKKFLLVLITVVIFLKAFSLSAQAVTSTPSATFILPPFPPLDIPYLVPACELNGSKDETIYPPNSACYAETKRTQIEIDKYTKTCIKEPSADYADTRGISGPTGSETCMGKDGDISENKLCDVYITVFTDVSKAELGSYGPDNETLLGNPADTLAKKYLFNSIFDRPYFSIPETPREIWRTYWRLLPINEQFNLVAQFINLVNLSDSLDNATLKRINNTKWQYVDKDYVVHETTVKELSDSLPQCLKTEPVCPEFATVYNNLSDDIKAAYDTIIPLSFNNLRGFIALLPPVFPDRTPIPGTVSRESKPYIETIFAGLLSKKYGLLGNLQPDWLFTKSLTDLTDTNTGYDLTTGRDNYISGQFGQNKFDDDELTPIVLSKADIISCPDYPDVYNISAPRTFPRSRTNTCPEHTQEIQILGSTLNWSLEQFPAIPIYDALGNIIGYKCEAPVLQQFAAFRIYDAACNIVGYYCDSPAVLCGGNQCCLIKQVAQLCGDGTQCCQYGVTGKGKGKALTVFNNPKTTDIKQSVIGNSETSLYNTLLPDALLTPTPVDKKIDAPTSTHNISKNTDYSGYSLIKNPNNPIFRENNQAQDTVHLIQNCWLVPSDQQSSAKCGIKLEPTPPAFSCDDCDPNVPDGATAMALKPKFIDLATRWLGVGHPAIDKFETVVNSAVAAGVNPIFTLAIWLNESNASNYDGLCESLGHGDPTSGYCNHVLDFGINNNAIASNYITGKFFFNEQLSVFLGLPNYYKSVCPEEMKIYCPMRVFAAMFAVGVCEPPAGDGYLSGIQTIYNWLAPNLKFPCYPSAYP